MKLFHFVFFLNCVLSVQIVMSPSWGSGLAITHSMITESVFSLRVLCKSVVIHSNSINSWIDHMTQRSGYNPIWLLSMNTDSQKLKNAFNLWLYVSINNTWMSTWCIKQSYSSIWWLWICSLFENQVPDLLTTKYFVKFSAQDFS